MLNATVRAQLGEFWSWLEVHLETESCETCIELRRRETENQSAVQLENIKWISKWWTNTIGVLVDIELPTGS